MKNWTFIPKISIGLMLFIGTILIGCNSNPASKFERNPPKKLLSRMEMINLLKEIHLAEAVTASSSLTYHKSLARFKRYKLHILEKYNLDSTEFAQNFEYYMSDMDDLGYIYQALSDTFLLRKHRKNF